VAILIGAVMTMAIIAVRVAEPRARLRGGVPTVQGAVRAGSAEGMHRQHAATLRYGCLFAKDIRAIAVVLGSKRRGGDGGASVRLHVR